MPHHPPELAKLSSDQTLYVVSVISNPAAYHSRYRLYRQFERHMLGFNVKLITVELALRHRQHEVTSSSNPYHVQVRGDDELWHKENMINLGFQRLSQLHPDWDYVAWVDADLQFLSPTWVEDTLHSLQRHRVVQLFSDCMDMGPRGEVLQHHLGFARQYQVHGLDALLKANGNYASSISYPHSGYAWAARREVIDGLGGLLDWAILGAADHHMAWAFIEQVKMSDPGGLHPNYSSKLNHFQDRCKKVVQKDIGFVPGTLVHSFHGSKKKRFYIERWEVLRKHSFDPAIDIIKDSQGVWQLAGEKHGLRDDLRRYNNSRDEDGSEP